MGSPPRLEGSRYPRHGVPPPFGGWRLPSTWGPTPVWRVAATLELVRALVHEVPAVSTSRSGPHPEGGSYPRTDLRAPERGCVPWSTSTSTPRLEGGSYPRVGPRARAIGCQVPSSWPARPSDRVPGTLELARAPAAAVPAMVALRAGPHSGRGETSDNGPRAQGRQAQPARNEVRTSFREGRDLRQWPARPRTTGPACSKRGPDLIPGKAWPPASRSGPHSGQGAASRIEVRTSFRARRGLSHRGPDLIPGKARPPASRSGPHSGQGAASRIEVRTSFRAGRDLRQWPARPRTTGPACSKRGPDLIPGKARPPASRSGPHSGQGAASRIEVRTSFRAGRALPR
jgi:hypothetical protein